MADFNQIIGNAGRDLANIVKEQIRDMAKEVAKEGARTEEKISSSVQENISQTQDKAKAAIASAKNAAAVIKSKVNQALSKTQELNQILQPRPTFNHFGKSTPAKPTAHPNPSQPTPSNLLSTKQQPAAMRAMQKPTGAQSPAQAFNGQSGNQEGQRQKGNAPPSSSSQARQHGASQPAAHPATTGSNLLQHAAKTALQPALSTPQPQAPKAPTSTERLTGQHSLEEAPDGNPKTPKKLTLTLSHPQNAAASPKAAAAKLARSILGQSSPEVPGVKVAFQEVLSEGPKLLAQIFNFGEKPALPEAAQNLLNMMAKFQQMAGEAARPLQIPLNAAAALAEKQTTVGEIGKNLAKLREKAEEGGDSGKESVAGLMTHFVQGMRRDGQNRRF